jgi:hypothetical protein
MVIAASGMSSCITTVRSLITAAGGSVARAGSKYGLGILAGCICDLPQLVKRPGDRSIFFRWTRNASAQKPHRNHADADQLPVWVFQYFRSVRSASGGFAGGGLLAWSCVFTPWQLVQERISPGWKVSQ